MGKPTRRRFSREFKLEAARLTKNTNAPVLTVPVGG